MQVAAIADMANRLKEQFHHVIVGKDETVTWMLTALLVDGHVLLEGVPGTSKR